MDHDGHKRAAFMAAGLFLELNGWRLNASPSDAISAILMLASGKITEKEFAEWLKAAAERKARALLQSVLRQPAIAILGGKVILLPLQDNQMRTGGMDVMRQPDRLRQLARRTDCPA